MGTLWFARCNQFLFQGTETTKVRTGLILLVGCLLLASCGFHLRGTGIAEHPAISLHVTAANSNAELLGMLERTLSGDGMKLVDDRALAPWTVSLLDENFSRRVASTTRGISVAKYQLILQVRFSLSARDGKLLIPATSLTVERMYDYDSSNLVGSDTEQTLLRDEMRMDIVERMIRRIETTISSQNSQ